MNSPIRGCGERCENKTIQLEKENFDLRRRLYLLEQRVGVSSSDYKDDLVKENMELKVMWSFSLRIFVCALQTIRSH